MVCLAGGPLCDACVEAGVFDWVTVDSSSAMASSSATSRPSPPASPRTRVKGSGRSRPHSHLRLKSISTMPWCDRCGRWVSEESSFFLSITDDWQLRLHRVCWIRVVAAILAWRRHRMAQSGGRCGPNYAHLVHALRPHLLQPRVKHVEFRVAAAYYLGAFRQ